jgi:hypothetical protein
MPSAARFSAVWALALGISASSVFAADISALSASSSAAAKAEIPRPALRGAKALGPYSVFDTDHDGSISALEISAAAEVLRKLDKNKDGVLTAIELRPERPPRPPHESFGEHPPGEDPPPPPQIRE